MYAFDFRQDPLAAGWAFEPPKDGGRLVAGDDGVELTHGGRVHGPEWPCPADQHRQWYRLRFTTRASGTAYILATFLDGQGRELAASLYGAVDASDAWLEQTCCFRGRWGGATWSIGLCSAEPCAIRDIAIDAIDAETAARWGDDIRRTLPAVDYIPPPGHGTRLPDAMRRLHEGERLRVVMLGDSLTHDTRCSNFDALLPRHYPAARVDVIVSARGSTGCWFYQEDENFAPYVANLKPDLLVIGVNVSHERMDAVRRVAERARAELGCELALLAPAFGPDWRDASAAEPDGALPASEWPGQPLFEAAQDLAEELGIEYIDMATPWQQYLGRSRKPFQWFHRDRVHGNNRGMQAVATMLERYWMPSR